VPAAERCIDVNASPETLFEVITSYADYPEFLPEIESASVVAESDGAKRVRFVLNIVKRVRYTLELVEDSPRSVRWTLIDGDLRANSGSWTLERLPDGVRATYRVDVEVGIFVPGAIVSRLVGETLPATLQAFARRAEARSSS